MEYNEKELKKLNATLLASVTDALLNELRKDFGYLKDEEIKFMILLSLTRNIVFEEIRSMIHYMIEEEGKQHG